MCGIVFIVVTEHSVEKRRVLFGKLFGNLNYLGKRVFNS